MTILKALVVMIFSFVFWGLVAALLAHGFLDAAPCHWFGSAFEGECGYRALYFTLIASAVLTMLLTLATVVVYLRMSRRVDK